MSSNITLTIDGKKISVQNGVTLYWAAKKAGVEIPHLCYGEDLPPMSSCRLCVVEVEGMRSLAASCSHAAAEGMVVHTDTERVRNARRFNLELILSDHKVDCITCEKSGTCLLEKYAYEFGITRPPFEGERNERGIRDDDPFIVRDYDKCILCGRCVYVCNEVQFDRAINIGARGFPATIATAFDRKLQDTTCVSCGRCISVCPVGALIEKNRIGKGREWELTSEKTICPYCGCGCTLEMHTKENKLVKVTTPDKNTVNNGNLCVKGKFGTEFIDHPERLTKPLIKRNGSFEETSWEEALSYTVENLTKIKEKYGPNAIGGLSSAKCTNEENYIFQKFIRACIGTNNVDHCARLCHSSTVTGLARAFGSGAMTNSMAELRNADCILVTGSNTTEAHPIIALDIKAAVEKNGGNLIVADPRRIGLVPFADLWLRHKSGTDVALFNGIMNVIINEGLADEEFIAERTENYEQFREVVLKYEPKRASEISGVPAEDIVKAARMYATAGTASIVYSMGITQHTTGTDNVLSLANLAMLTGNIGKKHTGVNPLRGQNNVQGACDLGALPNVYPGYQKVTDEMLQKKFEEAWKTSLSPDLGLTVVEMLHGAEDGSVRGMYIMGENPFLSDPNINRVKKDLEAMEFIVVQDIFLSDTAEYADVVLPAASFAEKDGTFTNTERRVQLLQEIRPAPGEARLDWEILCDVSSRMGYPMRYDSTSHIMEEINSVMPIYGGITHKRIERMGLQWPCPTKDHPGTPYLHKDAFARGKGLFSAVDFIDPAELPDEEYPYALTTGRILYHFHTGTMSRRAEGLDEARPDGFVEIHPIDAKALAISDGENTRISSRRGTVTARAVVTKRSRPGSVFMAFHFKEAAANILTNDALDPIAKIPEFKVCAVKVEKA